MIDIYVATDRGLEVRPLDMNKFTKIRAVVPIEEYPNSLEFPLPEIFTRACGNADVAICIDKDGQNIAVAVPKGQRWKAQSLVAA